MERSQHRSQVGAESRPGEDQIGLEAIMSRAGSENFPVALRLLPSSIRGHLQAIYGYARLVDNLGDEYRGDRAQVLDWLEGQLDLLFAGAPDHPIFRRLSPAVETFGLSRTSFDRLLEANRMDQVKTRYSDWDDLMGYCKLSANPVGRLVLAVFEADTPRRVAASDSVCSGLQVLEHLQDIGEDARAGRIYIPASYMDRYSCTVEDLLAPEAGPDLRRMVASLAERTVGLLEPGKPLVRSLSGWYRVAIGGYVAGGLAGLDALAAAKYEVLGGLRQAGRIRQIRRFLPLYVGGIIKRERWEE
ncbi:MAG: squalene synthase HpnC [Acidimicrobiia bacterium]|nr:squalene synthase HpnC [bacterium]MDE0642622.1 squalene synthase HpnC [bacterium]MXZ07076.1 squalene synthase HpnC [Acidimicrobiia bacterium]MYD05263.1 squalene synthase HpnC [Acidimicrobiia bacterium]